MENDHYNLRRDQWQNRVSSRSTPRDPRAIASMARPADESGAARRPKRVHLDITVLLGIAFVGLLCASVTLLLIMMAPSARTAEQPLLPAVGAANPQNAVIPGPAPTGQTKILLLGSDQRPEDGGYRTDVIILVVLDADQKTVSAVSFPRDLWVSAPTLYEMKINQVHALGGFEATAETFAANFGVRPDYYVLTNFAGFTQLIDNQGGVDVEVGQTLTDDCDLPQARDGDCTVEPGTVHMDGKTALWYVRSRHTSSDLDRLRREQEVLFAVFKKMVSLGSLAQFNQIQAQLADNVETNMSVEQAIRLLPAAASALSSPDKIRRYAIGEEQATPSWSWDGMWILLPDLEAIQGVLREAGIR